MGAAIRIATKDLKLRVRDRSVFILGILAPLVLAFIFNFVFGDALTANTLDLRFGLVDLDDTEISQSFGDILVAVESEGILTLTDYESAGSAEAAVEEGEIDAYYVIDPGMEEAVLAGEGFDIRVIGNIDAPTSTQIAAGIAEQYGSGVAGVQLAVATSFDLLDGPPPAEAAGWGQEAAGRGQSFVLDDVTTATRQLDPTTYFSAGMAVFFLFFTVQFGVVGLLEEKRDGTMARLLAAPIRRTSVITGKALLSLALGIISVGVLMVTTRFVMDAVWGPPLGVALLVVAGVLSAVAIMGLVGSVARTPEGAGNLGAIIAVTLGMLGGTFFPVGQGDDLLSKLTFLTPHAWFMGGLADISGGAEWTAALPSVAALLVFSLVLGSVAWVVLRRRIAE
ncbi:MAG TPA: ABC transporter permease [Acidimicrobiia bacterium]|nr:ABC transporter permease [Acidimicrobiia bacterium]